ncbi:UDP-glucuronosyltransferase 2B37 [Trichoplax sp. H2]|nr:UDP-glucuronosyltransferase 2B37 [Trichoplax sp. H2]|eukprot:RDD36760.1 UDP-glucuronosyltransferase 2B37 [Trichoplax sp. H2]
MKTVSETLIKKGHQVSIIIPENKLSMVDKIDAITFDTMDLKIGPGGKQATTLLEMFSLLYTFQGTFCRDLLRNGTISTLIKDYDIIITDSIYICSLMLPQIVNKRNVVMGIQGTLLSPIGYPTYPSNPAYIPQIGTTYSSKMNFFQRVKNTIAACLKELVVFNAMNYLAYSIKQEFNIRPDLGFYELMLSPEMTLVAGDFAVDYARPIPPNMKLIGPLSSVPASPLPEDLENFMESSGEHGVVLVSMGTIFEFPESLIPTLVAGFKRLEQKVLWKTRLNVENPPDNVKIVRWMPQNDILGHPKLKAFVTHGGSKSIYEASYHGVPLIGIPLQPEQQLNIGKARAAGVAIGLDRDNLTPNDIVESVTEITTNPWYKGNMSRISKSIQSRPISPREALVQWVEYIANNDVSHLKPVGLGMPWYQYYLLDVISFLVFCLYCIYKIFKYLLCWCCCSKNEDKIKRD